MQRTILSGCLLTLLCGCSILPDNLASTLSGDLRSNGSTLEGKNNLVHAEACRRTGIHLAEAGKDELAIAQLLHARELNPKITGVAHPLAVLYDRQRQIDAAGKEYQLALKETRRHPDVLNDYGYFLYGRQEFTQARSVLEEALHKNAQHSKARINLAMVQYSVGQRQEALRQFATCVGEASAHYNLGMLLLRDGQEAEGREHLSLALQRDPGLEQALTVLETMNEAEHKSQHRAVATTEPPIE